MKLIPGIDTNETPALNQAAFSQSQFVRFMQDRNGMGLIQKLGGWTAWTNKTFPNTTELRPWEDLNGNARLAIGTTTGLYWISQNAKNTPVTITPQTFSGVSPVGLPQTATITIASPAVITVATAPLNGTPVTFTTTGALPTGLSVGTVYYVINATPTTFQVANRPNGTVVNTTGSQSGTQSVTIPIASTVSGSSTVTIYDTGTGVQTVSFANNIVTIGSSVSGGTGTPPANGGLVVFLGSSLPSGITANTGYYVINATSTTYQISSSSTSTTPVSFGTGSGTQYLSASYSSTPSNQQLIQNNYTVNIKTPISIGGLFLSGLYTITSLPDIGSYYNIYTITASSAATSTSATVTTNQTSNLPVFTTNSGLNTVTVTEFYHPYITGSTAAFLAPTIGNGVTIYGNYPVTLSTTSPTTQFTITLGSAATQSGNFVMGSNQSAQTLGYASFQYYFNVAAISSGSGYGTGGYGAGGYGSGVPLVFIPGNTVTTTDWSINNFGEILIANPQGGPIYYWSPSTLTYNAYILSTAPVANQGIFVAMPARQIVAYGSTATGIQDPLLIRWSDAGDATTWIASSNNQAGSYRIPEGSLIVGAIQGPQQALIWTDLAVWAMQYVGLPNVYGFNKLADGAGLFAKKAVGLLNGVTYWMSSQKFMMLSSNGAQVIPCPVWDKVFQNINTGTLSNGQPAFSLIRCGTNSTFGEVTWYYPSTNATYNDSYVKLNINTMQWDYGTLDRAAWTDQSVLGTPIGASSGGVIYQHELGYNNDTTAMVSSFQTGYMQLNEADNMVFVDQIWPDFKWSTSGGGTGGATSPATLYVTFYGTNYPGDTPTAYGPYTITSGTEYISTRIRNRLLSIAVSTSSDGTATNAAKDIFFRIGALRYRYQLDGKF